MNVALDPGDLERLTYEHRFPLEQRLARTGIPEKYWCGWESFSTRSSTAKMRTMLMSYEDDFKASGPRMNEGRGFLLQGPPGVGKTMASCILGANLVRAGFFVRFVSLAAYMTLVTRQITLQQLWGKHDDLDALQEWQRTDDRIYAINNIAHLVILDDVGKEHRTQSGWAEDCFDQLLRHRVQIGRPVAMTSNLALKNWGGLYSESMQSFVYEAGAVISVRKNDDMRRGDEEDDA